jgi:hypothetical protein
MERNNIVHTQAAAQTHQDATSIDLGHQACSFNNRWGESMRAASGHHPSAAPAICL